MFCWCLFLFPNQGERTELAWNLRTNEKEVGRWIWRIGWNVARNKTGNVPRIRRGRLEGHSQEAVLCPVQFSRSVVSDSLQPYGLHGVLPGQASLSITNSWSLLKLMSIELLMPSNHLSLCCPLLLPPSIFPSIRVFSNESILHIRWPKYWNFSFSIRPSNEYERLISFRMDWGSPCSLRDSRVFSNTTVQKHQFFGTQLSLQSNSHIHA